MKRTPIALVLAAAASATAASAAQSPACCAQQATAPVAANSDATDGIVLRIEGMTCQGCATTVEQAIRSVDGVRDVGVLLDSKVAWVLFDSSGALSDDLIAAVEGAGFEASLREGVAIAVMDEDGNKRVIGGTPQGGTPACAVTIPDSSDGPTVESPVISLQDSLNPLISEFNAAKDKPRIVALLSPTCGGCVHAARAIAQEAMQAYPQDDFVLLVVWESMLASDDEDAARRSASILDDPRSVQFWDADRLSGIAYSRDLYPSYINDIARSMPADHPLSSHFAEMGDVPGERSPMWDFAAFYPAGVEWGQTPPQPTHFIRQLAIFKQPDGTTSATLYTDDFTNGPEDSDWFDEVQERMPIFLGKSQAAAR